MNEQECLSKMTAPGTPREGKYRGGVIQIHVTRACDKACFSCTQGSQYAGKVEFITPELFESAVLSLKDYWGVVGVFGGNPAMHPQFDQLCAIMRKHIPFDQRGLWSNNPLGKGQWMRETFCPSVSNLNVHLDREAYAEFKRDWPECQPVGLTEDSRHSPPFVAMKDVIRDVEKCWDLISDCDINKHWSAMIGVFRGYLRAWFCEVAGAQAMLHQHEPDYPDTGIDPTRTYFLETGTGADSCVSSQEPQLKWWQLQMVSFASQVRKHCFECSIPLRGYGELAQAEQGEEQTSVTHADVCKPKRKGRMTLVVTQLEQLGVGRLQNMTKYLQNSRV